MLRKNAITIPLFKYKSILAEVINKERCWECAVTGKQSALLGHNARLLLHPNALLVPK